VAGVVPWLLLLEENVGRDHTIDVTGADDDSDDDAALVDTFDVVAAPGKSVGNGRVNLKDLVSDLISGQCDVDLHTPMAPRKVPAYWMCGLSEAISCNDC
jgi:hypothetical protein